MPDLGYDKDWQIGKNLKVSKGACIGHLGTAVDDVISIGDGNLAIGLGPNPYVQFDTADGITYIRSGNKFTFNIGGSPSYLDVDGNGIWTTSIIVGSPTGSWKGAGTINIQGDIQE